MYLQLVLLVLLLFVVVVVVVVCLYNIIIGCCKRVERDEWR
jgi:hypothetical protein